MRTDNKRPLLGTMLVLLLSVLAATWTRDSSAQWELRERNGGQPPVATVRSDGGEILRILSSKQSGVVFGTLMLPAGLAALAEDGCPSFRIDTRAPGSFADGGSCKVKGRSVTFVLGNAVDGRIKSRALKEMMGGRRLTIIYRYAGLGYAEASFALNGSLQALTSALSGLRVASAR